MKSRITPHGAPPWIGSIGPVALRCDLAAGLTNVAVLLPQGIAFAIIAGLPPEYGLYTSMVSAAVAAVFGSSMVVVSGATTALSALLFSTLSDPAPLGSAQYINYVLVTTLLVGVFQCAGRPPQLGRIVSSFVEAEDRRGMDFSAMLPLFELRGRA